MKALKLSLLALLFYTLTLSAQPVPIAGPFKISRDDTTASFLQDKPFTTTYDSLSFFVSWRDTRIYPQALYGVRLNGAGQPETENLSFKKMWDGEDIIPFGNKYLSLTHSIQIFGPNTQHNYSGNLLSLNGNVNANIPVTGVTIGDIQFYPGTYFSSFVKNNKLYLFSSIQEETKLTVLDSTGAINFRKDTAHAIISGFTAACNINGRVITAYLNYNDYNIKIDCYNSSDSVVVKGKSLLQLPRLLYPYGTSPIRILTTRDNNFLITLYYADTVYTSLISPEGNFVQPVIKYPFRAGSGESYWNPVNFALTNYRNGTADLFVTTRNIESHPVLRTKIFSFSESGSLTDTAGTYSFQDTIKGGVFKTGKFTYLTADTSRGDIYLKEIKNFSITLVRKLNDDRGGSNEVKAKVVKTQQGKMYAVWENGSKAQAQSFTVTGTVSGNAVTVPSSNVFGHPDGTLRFLAEGSNGILLIYKYNAQLQPIGIDTLLTGDGPILNPFRYCGITLPNNNIMYLVSTYSRWSYAVLTTPEGVLLASDTLNTTAGNGNDPAIYIADGVSVYASVGTIARKYLFSLQRIGATGSTSGGVYTAGHIFGQAYIMVGFDYQARFVLDMRRTDGTIAVNQKNIGSIPALNYQNQVGYNRLGLFTLQNTGSLQFRVFDTTATDIITPLPIEPAGIVYDWLSYTVADYKVFFVWSDNRNGNADVFCKVYPLSPFTGIEETPAATVPEKFSLSPVYPNPFNPSAKVRYTMPFSGEVKLMVYNTLGECVSVLYNGYRTAGEYTQEFTAAHLPAGVYFVKLQSGANIQTAKCLLLK